MTHDDFLLKLFKNLIFNGIMKRVRSLNQDNLGWKLPKFSEGVQKLFTPSHGVFNFLKNEFLTLNPPKQFKPYYDSDDDDYDYKFEDSITNDIDVIKIKEKEREVLNGNNIKEQGGNDENDDDNDDISQDDEKDDQTEDDISQEELDQGQDKFSKKPDKNRSRSSSNININKRSKSNSKHDKNKSIIMYSDEDEDEKENREIVKNEEKKDKKCKQPSAFDRLKFNSTKINTTSSSSSSSSSSSKSKSKSKLLSRNGQSRSGQLNLLKTQSTLPITKRPTLSNANKNTTTTTTTTTTSTSNDDDGWIQARNPVLTINRNDTHMDDFFEVYDVTRSRLKRMSTTNNNRSKSSSKSGGKRAYQSHSNRFGGLALHHQDSYDSLGFNSPLEEITKTTNNNSNTTSSSIFGPKNLKGRGVVASGRNSSSSSSSSSKNVHSLALSDDDDFLDHE